MSPTDIIRKFYKPQSITYDILITHGNLVAQKAMDTAECFQKKNSCTINMDFIYEASILHDIGIYRTHAPSIGCKGKSPYIAHGYIGRQMLERFGLYDHGNVCERHIGVGIEKKEIKDLKLPLPHHDMVPITIEEKIICYADKFFSKNVKKLDHEKSIDEIITNLMSFSQDKADRFFEWHQNFS